MGLSPTAAPPSYFVTLSNNYGKQTEHFDGVNITVNARLQNGLLLQGGLGTGRQVLNDCEVVDDLPEMLHTFFGDPTRARSSSPRGRVSSASRTTGSSIPCRASHKPFRRSTFRSAGRSRTWLGAAAVQLTTVRSSALLISRPFRSSPIAVELCARTSSGSTSSICGCRAPRFCRTRTSTTRLH